MSKRFDSNRYDRDAILFTDTQGCADFGIHWTAVAADHAVAEAARVLAETEAGAVIIEEAASAYRHGVRYPNGKTLMPALMVGLAESLTAALPLLDELAEPTFRCRADVTSADIARIGMFNRNRATDAALDVRS